MPTLALNKKARFDYEILESFEGGLVLAGHEVKSIKAGHAQLKGSFLHIYKNELWLKGAYIAPYKPAGPLPDYDPYQNRKVLIHKKELKKLIGKKQMLGISMIPLSIYTKGGLVKLEFAMGKGKKKYEKRESIKKRDIQRQMQEKMKE
jgi:SsrA-binding protein